MNPKCFACKLSRIYCVICDVDMPDAWDQTFQKFESNTNNNLKTIYLIVAHIAPETIIYESSYIILRVFNDPI